MVRITIVGDGPGGLSAALFLVKNGHQVVVFGEDKTAMHHAYLYNYLGIPEVPGSELQAVARAQVEAKGAVLRNEHIESVEVKGEISTTTSSGEVVTGDYLILSEGKNPVLARSLGLAEENSGAISVDRDFRSSMDRVYVVGRSARPSRSQAIISAGAGATAALDILARETGEDVQDWDTPPKN
ncbi:MAG TPA: FAD-dependent oxidoreductase [Acidimicrobiia bacterium]|nr:FAD-dependent oxidoreductase [Acidimicrobiia bacterium]